MQNSIRHTYEEGISNFKETVKLVYKSESMVEAHFGLLDDIGVHQTLSWQVR